VNQVEVLTAEMKSVTRQVVQQLLEAEQSDFPRWRDPA
jgi:hypothetical protein